MKKEKSKRQQLKELKRKEIIQTASKLFSNKGFANTSIFNITSEVGISKGLLYNYFTSKDELIKEIILYSFDKLISNFNPNKDGILTNDEFVFFINDLFKSLSNNSVNWKLIFQLLTQPGLLDISIHLLKRNSKYIDFRITLDNYFKDNTGLKTIYFFSVFSGIAIGYFQNPTGFPLEEIKNNFIRDFKKD